VRGWRLCGIRVALAVLSLLLGARADAADVMVRWLPSSGASVAGYNIRHRLARAACDRAVVTNAGNPAPGSDGTLSFVVPRVDTTNGKVYRFAVTSYTSDGEESAFSNEVTLGPRNPCEVDRCYSPTSGDRWLLPDGTSCDDSSFCNGAETCSGGACVNGGRRNCADSVACTVDTCDDGLGRCVHTGPRGCCPACDSGDPCQDSACAAGDCMAPPGDELAVSRLKLMGAGDRIKLAARGSFTPSGPFDPTVTGALLEFRSAAGDLLYQAFIAASGFRVGDNGGRFRFKAGRDEGAAVAGLRILDLRRQQGAWLVTAMARGAGLASVRAASGLSWVLRFGDTCVRRMDTQCAALTSSVSVCR